LTPDNAHYSHIAKGANMNDLTRYDYDPHYGPFHGMVEEEDGKYYRADDVHTFLRTEILPWVDDDKTKEQIKAVIGDA
jgi:hypothetical protein